MPALRNHRRDRHPASWVDRAVSEIVAARGPGGILGRSAGRIGISALAVRQSGLFSPAPFGCVGQVDSVGGRRGPRLSGGPGGRGEERGGKKRTVADIPEDR